MRPLRLPNDGACMHSARLIPKPMKMPAHSTTPKERGCHLSCLGLAAKTRPPVGNSSRMLCDLFCHLSPALTSSPTPSACLLVTPTWTAHGHFHLPGLAASTQVCRASPFSGDGNSIPRHFRPKHRNSPGLSCLPFTPTSDPPTNPGGCPWKFTSED